MELSEEQSIGVFDSGIGGLTIVNAIKNILPNENIIYFGDTAHLPYGDKSKDSIIYYSLKITDFLLKQNCKLILIACNSASALAYNQVKNFINNKAIIIDVINPVIEYIKNKKKFTKIAVIGTKATINSNTYVNKIHKLIPKMKIISLATPLFVPMIEEGFIYDDISNAIIRTYLNNPVFKNIDAIILGCTHYPVIKNQIRKFFDFKVKIIDSSIIVAQKLKSILSSLNLLNNTGNPFYKYYVSDYSETFKKITKIFSDEEIELEKLNLWRTE